MSNIDKDAKNIMIGLGIGSLVGIGVALIYQGAKHHHQGRKPAEFLGKTLSQIGEIMQHPKASMVHAYQEVEQTAMKNENKIADILEWTAATIYFLKNLRGGK
jgi:hypothetical protein